MKEVYNTSSCHELTEAYYRPQAFPKMTLIEV